MNDKLHQDGVEPQPGPNDNNADNAEANCQAWDGKGFVMEVVNATALRPNAQVVWSRKAHMVAITEHGAEEKVAKGLKMQAAQRQWNLELSGPCPEATKAMGGAGIALRKPKALVPLRHKTEEYGQAAAMGRIYTAWVDIGCGRHMLTTCHLWSS